MAIQGPLRELDLHDVCQLLDLGRKTGILRVTSELRQNEGVIWFESGAVVAATVRSNPHRIGDVLLRSGKIREEELVQAAAMQAAGDSRRLGEILVSIGALNQREMERHVRLQVEEVVFAVLGWSEGWFVFEECAPADIPRDANVRIATDALLMEGARRIDEWARIQPRVPHLGVVPHLAAPEQSEPNSLHLTPLEWRVLAACDGVLDVRALAHTLACSEFDLARTLFGLAAAGVVSIRDPAASNAAGPAPQSPAALHRQGEEYLRRGDPAAARTVADALLASRPDDPRAHQLRGQSLLAEQRYADAERALREAARLDPSAAAAWRLLGYARSGQGRFHEALHAWGEWLRLPHRPGDEERHLPAVTRLADAARLLADAVGARDGVG